MDKRDILMAICLTLMIAMAFFSYQQNVKFQVSEERWQQRLDRMSLDVKSFEEMAEESVMMMAEIEIMRINTQAKVEELQQRLDDLNQSKQEQD